MHEQFLLAALNQACLGRGLCAPNPSVGAVAVHNGQIIAQTWHHGAGTPHAERLLLEQLPKNIKNISDITLYVTLEPCNHWGKTPPCVDAIVSFGIKKVVYAYRDPNPIIVANNTPRLLREHGIDILHYPLPEIDSFYQSYRYWTLTKKPWVSIKMAQTMDGKIAGKNGVRISLSNELCAQFTHKKRLQSDVILTTARTVNIDNPLLNARLPDGHVAKPIAIIDNRCTLNPAATIFTTAKHCHIYSAEHKSTQMAYQNSTHHVVPSTDGFLDLESVILHLGQLGYHDVWIEAGGTLFSSLHLARLINRTYLYIVPAVLGGAAMSAYHHIDMFNQACNVSWQSMGDNMMAILDWVA